LRGVGTKIGVRTETRVGTEVGAVDETLIIDRDNNTSLEDRGARYSHITSFSFSMIGMFTPRTTDSR